MGTIRFTDMCQFFSIGNTKYKADTVGTVYTCSPNDFDLINLEGVGGSFRSLVGICSYSGGPTVTIQDIFVDAGCPVIATFSSYNGGNVYIDDGERINSHSQNWMVLAEAPACLRANIQSKRTKIPNQTSSICYNLNQLSMSIDFDVGEVIGPNEAYWLSKGLYLEFPSEGNTSSPIYFDFRQKGKYGNFFGYADFEDSIVSKTPGNVITTPVIVQSKSQEYKYSHWAMGGINYAEKA